MPSVPRYARVSRRGRWHTVSRVIERTKALQTACGRILPKVLVEETIAGPDTPARERRCEKCAAT